MTPIADLTGQVFGHLTPQWPVGISHGIHWLCLCDCGTVKVFSTKKLTSKHPTRSCGCASTTKSHGQSRGGKRTPAYSSWRAMRCRCLSPNHHKFRLYGGAGILICDRWLTFTNFFQDLGPRPPGTTLGRKNDTGNYEPGNAWWQTREEQEANKRKKAA